MQYVGIASELTPGPLFPILHPIKSELPILINLRIDLSLDLEGINNEVPEMPV